MKTNLNFFLSALISLILLSAASADEVTSPGAAWKNLAKGKPALFNPAPGYPLTSDENDAVQLTDGQFATASPIWLDKKTVGWVERNLVEIVIDLGAVQPVRGVAIHSGAGDGGVEWPSEIQLFISDNGEKYFPLGDLFKIMSDKMPDPGYKASWFMTDKLKTYGRYVKFVVNTTGVGKYFFTDEIEIYQGDKSWLKLTRSETVPTYAASLPEQPANVAPCPQSPFPNYKNLALGRKMVLPVAPNYSLTSDSKDNLQLTDGRISLIKQEMWYDPEKLAVAWVGIESVVFIVDLGQPEAIRGAALHFAAGLSGIDWPASIKVYTSADGKKYVEAGDIMTMLVEKPPTGSYATFWLRTDKFETWGRYVKIVCRPSNLPSGGDGYIMLDEVEIYKGDDKWLKRTIYEVKTMNFWKADLQKLQWTATPSAISADQRPVSGRFIDGKNESKNDASLYMTSTNEFGLTFSLVGEAGKARGMSWEARVSETFSTEKCPYAVLTFRAEGIRHKSEPRPTVVLMGANDLDPRNSAVPLLTGNMAFNDGRSHTVVSKVPTGFSLEKIGVNIFTESDNPRFTIEKLELMAAMPDVFSGEVENVAQQTKGLIFADLSTLTNGSLLSWCDSSLIKHKMLLDGARVLKPGLVNVSGAQFKITDAEKNLAIMPVSTPSQQNVKFLGIDTPRSVLYPESRHDQLSIDADVRASEVYLLLAFSTEPTEFAGAWLVPVQLIDIECLSVELVYDQGKSEIAFPYSLADQACYIPARELGAYAVAADRSRKLKKVILHNRRFGPNFALAALTFNTSDKPLVAQLGAINKPVRNKINPEPATRELTVTRLDSLLTIANRWMEYRFDLARGFSISGIVNRWNEKSIIKIAPDSGLRIRIKNDVFTGRCFSAEVLRQTTSEVVIKLKSSLAELPLELTVTITASASAELVFKTKAKNTGNQPISFDLCLPALSGLAIGELETTKMFFPQMRTVDTAENIFLRAPYGTEYQLQFFDIYNPAAGIGLMLRTDNQQLDMIDFLLNKNRQGVNGGAQIVSAYNVLAPEAAREYPPVSLIIHNGDWRNALDNYRAWVNTWYKPFKAQDKDFFLNAWDHIIYRPGDQLSREENNTPGVFTPDFKEFRIDENLAFDQEKLGHIPDFVHLFNWTHTGKQERGTWSSDYIYNKIGGLEKFRSGISQIQNRWKRPVSLYTYGEEVSVKVLANTISDKERLREILKSAGVTVAEQSSFLTGQASENMIYPLKGADAWYEYFINDLIKMQRDTGCNMVYVDVFPYFAHERCVPGTNPLQAGMKFIKSLRAGLPQNVVLWGEYGAPDILSQFADGGATYYYYDIYTVFCRPYNNYDKAPDLYREVPFLASRYVMPKYRTLMVNSAYEGMLQPSTLDAGFHNGDNSCYNTRRLVESRILAKQKRGCDIKRLYSDCFLSSNPQPRVDTEVQGISANLFPGKNRNLWTINNGRPKTFSGVVLAVPHQQGAKYYDVWNDQEIQPVIENGLAKISLSIDPQQPGCIVQERKP